MHRGFNSHRTKNEEDMGLELERNLELFFSKNLKLTIVHPLPVFSVLLLSK
jgi:hypothetical protein